MLTERYGSHPITSIPRLFAALATRTPIAPRPITPSFLPAISWPAKFFLAFSIALPMFASEAFALTHSTPPITSRAASIRPPITNSLTPFALAPGVLNTTIPLSAALSRGMLLTPAPALAIALRLSLNSMSCITAERTRIISLSSTFSVNLYVSGSFERPL